jgi:hypothetical protein
LGRFDIYTVIGNEADFLTVHLAKVSDIVKEKIDKASASE